MRGLWGAVYWGASFVTKARAVAGRSGPGTPDVGPTMRHGWPLTQLQA